MPYWVVCPLCVHYEVPCEHLNRTNLVRHLMIEHWQPWLPAVRLAYPEQWWRNGNE